MTAPCIRNGKGTTLLIGIDRNFSDVESDDYSESARSYELGKVSDFACVRPRPDFLGVGNAREPSVPLTKRTATVFL